jgi:SIR2-like protein/TIR domain-containing protein
MSVPNLEQALEENCDALTALRERLHGGAGVIPFVGAGISVPMGLPEWSAFLRTRAAQRGCGQEVEECLKLDRYEEAAGKLLKRATPPGFQSLVEKTFGDDAWRGRPFSETLQLLPQLAKGPVVTTNFDRVVESVFTQARRPFRTVMTGGKPVNPTRMVREFRRELLKLHGDWDDYASRVLTLAEYQQHYGGPEPDKIDSARPLPASLQLLFLSRCVLFLGCGLYNDWTMHVLRSLQSEIGQLAHFAVISKPRDEAAFQDRLAFLNDHCIEPIWFEQGRFDLISEFLKFVLQAETTRAPRSDFAARPHLEKEGRDEKPQRTLRPARIFVSYARQDKRSLDNLAVHLKILQNQELIEVWDDRMIVPGEEWDEKIRKELDRADVILMLVSVHYLASKYCYGVEMKRSLERHNSREALAIPIIVDDCLWKDAPFARLQVLPKDGKPVSRYRDRDAAWTAIEVEIRKAIEEIHRGHT